MCDNPRRALSTRALVPERVVPRSSLIAGALLAPAVAVIGWIWAELLFWRVEPDVAIRRPAEFRPAEGIAPAAAPKPDLAAHAPLPRTPKALADAQESDGSAIGVRPGAAPAVTVPTRSNVAAPAPLPRTPQAAIAIDPFGESGPTLVAIPSPALATSTPLPEPVLSASRASETVIGPGGEHPAEDQ
jgi:hypothetical protein